MSDWPSVRLADVSDIRFSNVDKKSEPGELPARLCNYMDVYANDYVTSGIQFMDATVSPAELERFRVSRGDVLITKDSETPDDIGIASAVVDEIPGLVCGYHLALIKPDRRMIDSIYLAKQLSTPGAASYFGRAANGSTRYGLSGSSIANFDLPLAPLRVQRRIAEILSTVAEAIEQTEALIAKYQQVKAGLMDDLFTRGVLPDGSLRPSRDKAPDLYKETPLGWLPKEWEVGALRNCLVSSPTNGIYKPAGQIGSGVLLIGQTAISDERLVNPDLGRRAQVSREELNRFGLEAGDILVARVFATVDGVGQPAYVGPLNEPAVYESNMMRLRCDRRVIMPELLFEWLRAAFVRRRISAMVNASNQTSINQPVLNSIPVPLPRQEEQEVILAVCEETNRLKENEQDALSKLSAQKHGLMHDLLTGRVRVPTEEAVPV